MPRVHRFEKKVTIDIYRQVTKAAILRFALISPFEQWRKIPKKRKTLAELRPGTASNRPKHPAKLNFRSIYRERISKRLITVCTSFLPLQILQGIFVKIHNQISKYINITNCLTYPYKFIGNSFTPIPSCCHKNGIHTTGTCSKSAASIPPSKSWAPRWPSLSCGNLITSSCCYHLIFIYFCRHVIFSHVVILL